MVCTIITHPRRVSKHVEKIDSLSIIAEVFLSGHELDRESACPRARIFVRCVEDAEDLCEYMHAGVRGTPSYHFLPQSATNLFFFFLVLGGQKMATSVRIRDKRQTTCRRGAYLYDAWLPNSCRSSNCYVSNLASSIFRSMNKGTC